MLVYPISAVEIIFTQKISMGNCIKIHAETIINLAFKDINHNYIN